MKRKILSSIALILSVTAFFTGCGDENDSNEKNSISMTENITKSNDVSKIENNTRIPKELSVSFGDNGSPFTLHLYDNETSATIAGFVGTGDLRLPIYHFDDYENWEVMQYYDIPSSYNIPQNPETITSENAGEVYFAEPNRIVLFYKDAEISEEYTKIGYFDYSDDFVSAVENNPVLEGWENKIVVISKGNTN